MKWSKMLRIFIPCILVSGLVFCGVNIVKQLRDYNTSDRYYEQVQEQGVQGVNEEITPIDDIPIVEGAKQIDWESQKGMNAVAWIELDDISYPVYHDDGSQWYLHHLPDGTYATAGSIFLYGDNSADFTDQSSFIYGHNMRNETMFGNLKRYTDDTYRDHCFYLYLPDGTRHTYQFFAVASVDTSSEAYTWTFRDEQAFLDWQNWLKDNAVLDGAAVVDASGRFVTLSTCNGSAGTNRRLIVCGREVAVERTQNPASWYGELKAQIEAQKQEAYQTAYQRQMELVDIYQQTESDLTADRRMTKSQEE